MNKNYKRTHKLVAWILLWSLLLQSCQTFSNQPVPRTDQTKGKEKEKETKEDNDRNDDELLKDARNGNLAAQFQLGQRAYALWQADNDEEAYQRAREWLKKAADEEHPKKEDAILLLKKITREMAFEKFYFNNSLPIISEEEIQDQKPIKKGGCGMVFQATYKRRPVAIKQLIGGALTEKQLEDFYGEAMIMSNHRHKNIINFIGRLPSKKAIVMEYMSSGSLWDLLQKNRYNREWDVSWQLRYQIALDVAEGMCYLHDCGILHNDLKSDNILLDDQGHAKLTDFGISIIKSESSTFGQWQTEGTYQWMAPEIFLTETNTLAGDVYSYGMVLWQLGARKPPFETKNCIQVYKLLEAGEREVIARDEYSRVPQLIKIIDACWLPEHPPLIMPQRPTMKIVRYLLEENHPDSQGFPYRDYSFLENNKKELKSQLEQERKQKEKEIRELEERLAEEKEKEKQELESRLIGEKEELKSQLERMEKAKEELAIRLNREKQELVEAQEKAKNELATRLEKERQELEGRLIKEIEGEEKEKQEKENLKIQLEIVKKGKEELAIRLNQEKHKLIAAQEKAIKELATRLELENERQELEGRLIGAIEGKEKAKEDSKIQLERVKKAKKELANQLNKSNWLAAQGNLT